MPERVRLTPVEKELRRRSRRRLLILALVIAALVIYFLWRLNPDRPVDYTAIEEHFQYGSIGSELANGVPYWILKVLPTLFPDKLPGKGYASLGFIEQEGRDLPIGFSKRRVFIDRAWLNCGVCHTGTVRDAPGAPPKVYLGMPANTMDLQALIRFLIDCAQDERFTPDRMIPEIARIADLNFIERQIYRYVAIPQTRAALLARTRVVKFFERQPDSWGPGRVDTFNPYKAVQFNFPMEKLPDEEIIGVSDLPSIWQQRKKVGMHLHWDGNNDSVEERNKSAALGAGVTPTTIDIARIERIEDWLWDLEPPAYPYEINAAKAAQGKPLYERHCAGCHGIDGRNFDGEYVGKVTPLAEIGTDRRRLDSYTPGLAANQNTLYAGYPWRFNHFRKTNGYANMPLDGIWLRAPYLHNGSVPTVRDLLNQPDQRPQVFYRGYDVLDKGKLGFVADVASEGNRHFFKYDTRLAGNENRGHLYGTQLSPEEKDAVVEYMKQF